MWVSSREYPQKSIDWNRKDMPSNVQFHYYSNGEDLENSVRNISTLLEQENPPVQERVYRFDFMISFKSS